jgi:uncharacterized protein (TIGR03437 family)
VRKLTPGSVGIQTIVNAASLVAGPVAPGEAISIFGAGLGPATGVSGAPANGFYGTTLAGVSVLFDTTPAPLLYAGTSQINAIVPYDVQGKTSVRVQVQIQGSPVDSFTIAVNAAAPGIFTVNSSGQGQAAVVNANGTINSPANPASAGGIVSVYATGEGQTIPPGVSGQVTTGSASTLPKPALAVAVRIQGLPADILYFGAAPQSVGLMQINVRIPDTVFASNVVPLELTVGSFAAQPSVTIAVH